VLTYWGTLLLTATAGAAAASAWQERRASAAAAARVRAAAAAPRRPPTPPASLLYGVDVLSSTLLNAPLARRAAAYAAAAHAGQTRRSGEPYVAHCVETAAIVETLLADGGARSSARAADAVAAALLHDVPDDTPISAPALAAEFGAPVGALVAAVSRLSRAHQLLRRRDAGSSGGGAVGDAPASPDGDAAAARSMVVASIDDPLCLVIKLADRLHNMRTLWALPPAKRGAVARETLRVWAPLAGRLGLFALQGELEDLAFAATRPAEYEALRAELDAASPGPRARAPSPPPAAAALGDGAPECAALLATVPPFDATTFERPPGRGAGARARAAAAAAAAAARDAGSPPPQGSAPPALGDQWTAAGALLREVAVEGQATGLEVRVQGRLKSCLSVSRKAARKGVPPAAVLDARALRVVVSPAAGAAAGAGEGKSATAAAVAACYRILPSVRRLWRPIAGEDDDYILAPKPSGYQSLHTAVVGRRGAPVPTAPFEVQLRTGGMHAAAETGAAAHWIYKEAGGGGEGGASATPVAAVAAFPGVGAAPALAVGDAVARVSGGKLQLGAVLEAPEVGGVGAGDDASSALIAVRVAPRLDLAGRPPSRAEVDALLTTARDAGWAAAGRGGLRAKVEEFRAGRDGRWHRVDAYGRLLPVVVLPLATRDEAAEAKAEAVALADVADAPPPSTPAAMGDKIRLLRAMLAWTKDVEGGEEGGESGEGKGDSTTVPPTPAASGDLFVLVWPPGDIARVPRGTTAGALVAARAPEAVAAAERGAGDDRRAAIATATTPPPSLDASPVNVNNRIVPAVTALADGDFVVVSGGLLDNL